MSPAGRGARLAAALVALVENRGRLESRLAEVRALRRGASSLDAHDLSAELEAIARRLDCDLGEQAAATHDLHATLIESGLVSAAAAPVRRLLVVRVGGRQFALPQEAVESISMADDSTPSLADVLHLEVAAAAGMERQIALAGGARLLVDEVLRQDELVVRSLGPLLAGAAAFLGMTFAPEMTLVLNPEWLAARVTAGVHGWKPSGPVDILS